MRRIIQQISIAMMLCSSSQLLFAATEKAPQKIVQEIFEKVTKAEVAKNSKLQAEVNKNFDFTSMGKKALGKQFKKRSKEEQTWFISTLKEIITLSVYPNALDFFSGVDVSYGKAKIKKDQASLLSTLSKKGEETEVMYFFKKVDGEWRLVDVSIDDESWIETISDEVQSILKDEKWYGLKKRLNSRLVKLRKGQ